MTRFERAAQLWSVLVLTARHQQIISYEMAGQLTGIPKQGIGDNLSPIQDYCLQNKLPPLTALVVSERTGLPSEGFVAAKNVLAEQGRVFVYDWFSRPTPTPDDFERAQQKAKDKKENG